MPAHVSSSVVLRCVCVCAPSHPLLCRLASPSWPEAVAWSMLCVVLVGTPPALLLRLLALIAASTWTVSQRGRIGPQVCSRAERPTPLRSLWRPRSAHSERRPRCSDALPKVHHSARPCAGCGRCVGGRRPPPGVRLHQLQRLCLRPTPSSRRLHSGGGALGAGEAVARDHR